MSSPLSQTPLPLEGACLLQPRVWEDERGSFFEPFNADRFSALGLPTDWSQDNVSLSRAAFTLRGLHFQTGADAQAKLVRVECGRIFDVIVDLRPSARSYLRWTSIVLDNPYTLLFVPEGFAHGFLSLTADTRVAYKVTKPYAPQAEGGIIWNDPDLAIDWPLPTGTAPTLSDKDRVLPPLATVLARTDR